MLVVRSLRCDLPGPFAAGLNPLLAEPAGQAAVSGTGSRWGRTRGRMAPAPITRSAQRDRRAAGEQGVGADQEQSPGSPFFTTDRTASPSPIGTPGAGVCATTTQLRSIICIRPAPVASLLREKNTPAFWIRFCAACKFMHTTFGIGTVAACVAAGALEGACAGGASVEGAGCVLVGTRRVVVVSAIFGCVVDVSVAPHAVAAPMAAIARYAAILFNARSFRRECVSSSQNVGEGTGRISCISVTTRWG